MRDLTGNMPTLPRVFPDYFPVIVRTASDGLRELAMVSLFGNHGLTPERALVFSMYFGLTSILASLPGALAWMGLLFTRSQRVGGPDPQT